MPSGQQLVKSYLLALVIYEPRDICSVTTSDLRLEVEIYVESGIVEGMHFQNVCT